MRVIGNRDRQEPGRTLLMAAWPPSSPLPTGQRQEDSLLGSMKAASRAGADWGVRMQIGLYRLMCMELHGCDNTGLQHHSTLCPRG